MPFYLKVKGKKEYITWLGKHLQKEHPKTKGKTEIKKQR
jgi:hypothetical protein